MAARRNKNDGGAFAALGAATGLGNALRFPSLCFTYGGGFLFAYLCCLIFVCFPLLSAELVLGKKCGGKLESYLKSRRPKLGWLARSAALNSALIAAYYGIIVAKVGGAGVHYALFSACGEVVGAPLFLLVALSFSAVFFVLKGGAKRVSITGKASTVCSLSAFALLAVAALIKGGSFSAVFCFSPASLMSGSLWTDALGQSFLSLSLAAGVMPSFAAGCGDIPPCGLALRIIAANFFGGACAAYAALSLGSGAAEGGVTAALSLYPQVIAAAFPAPLAQRLFGTAFYGCLWVVAAQSAVSLFSPVLSATSGKRRTYFAAGCCLTGALLSPVFALGGGAALAATDRVCCSLNAVLLAFFECLLFLSPADMPRLPHFYGKFARGCLRFVCPAVCLAFAVISVCFARFSCFPPYALTVGAAGFVAVFSPLFAAASAKYIKKLKTV